MIQKVTIKTREEFEYCLQHGVNPLFWNRWVKLDFALRISLQYQLFGNTELGISNTIRANDRFYHYCFANSVMHCENCGEKLYKLRNYDCYNASYVSHIITKGSHAEMAHDCRNQNILCTTCHAKWENTVKKRDMVIYMDNIVVIAELKEEYSGKIQNHKVNICTNEKIVID